MANDTVRKVLIEVVGETGDARRALTALRVEAARADRQSVDIPVIVDTRKTESEIRKLEQKLDRLRGYNATPSVDLAIGKTESRIALLRQKLDSIGKDNVEAKVDIDSAPALKRIAALRSALIDLNDLDVDPRIVIKADQARATLAEVETDFVRAANAIKGVDFGDPQSIKAHEVELDNYRRALRAVQGEVGTTERAVRRWSQGLVDPGDNLNQSFRGFLGVIKQVNPVIQGISLVIFASAIPALIGLAGAATGAAGGLLSLVPAAGAAGVALGAGLVAIVKSVGQVLDLRKRKQQALDSQTRQNAQRDDELAGATTALSEAQRAVRDAFQQREKAQRALSTAEKAAAEGIRKAQEAAREAAAAVTSAAVDGYKAMRDAVQDARDAVLGLKDAQLDVEESKLNLKDAERELREFAAKGGEAMQELGKKFEDVSFDPKGLRDAVRNAQRTGAVGGDAASELERLTLAVERARLREKQATNNVTKAETSLKDARKTQADFAAKGIAAYEPYTDAVKRNTEAQKEAARVSAEGIKGNAAVISAKEQLRDANERIVESEARVGEAIKRRGEVLKGDVTGPMALFNKELEELTKGQRALYDSLGTISGPAKAFRDAIADPVLSEVSKVIKEIAGNMDGVNTWASQLGSIGAQNIRAFVDGLKADPQNGAALKQIGDGALETARILGGPVFRNFFQLMRNFAAATLPLVNAGLKRLGDRLGIAAENTNDWGKLRDDIRPLLRLAAGFAGVLGSVVKAMFALGRATEPVFTPFLKFIRDGIDGFTRFAKSAKGGERIRKFFADTMPLVKTLITNIALFGRVLLQAYEVVAPILQPVLAVFGLLLKGISAVLEVILKIPAPIRGLLAAFIPLGGIVSLIGKLGGALLKIIPFGGRILGAFRAAFAALGRLIAPVGGLFEGLAGAIGSFGRLAANGFLAPFRFLLGPLKAVIRLIVQGFATGWTAIKEVFSPVASFFGDVFGGIASVVETAFNAVIGVVKGAINIISAGVNVIIGAINAIPNIDTPFGSIGIPDIPKIPKLAKGGLTNGRTFAEIGEAGREAVIPLRGAVLRSIGSAIAAATPRLASGGSRLAAPGSGAGAQVTIEQVNITSPPGTDPDMVNASKKLGRAVAAVV